MRWLCLVRLPPRRGCLQAAGFPVAAGPQAADFHAAGLHAPADSTAHRCPGVGSAVEAAVPRRGPLRAPRIFPGQTQAGREAWLRKATLPAAGLNRAPRIFLSQGLAGQEAWLRKTTSRAAGISNRNFHRKFKLFLKGADPFYRQLLKVTSRDQDRRARDFLIFQEKAPV